MQRVQFRVDPKVALHTDQGLHLALDKFISDFASVLESVASVRKTFRHASTDDGLLKRVKPYLDWQSNFKAGAVPALPTELSAATAKTLKDIDQRFQLETPNKYLTVAVPTSENFKHTRTARLYHHQGDRLLTPRVSDQADCGYMTYFEQLERLGDDAFADDAPLPPSEILSLCLGKKATKTRAQCIALVQAQHHLKADWIEQYYEHEDRKQEDKVRREQLLADLKSSGKLDALHRCMR